MRFIEYLTEMSEGIGVAVSQPGDPEHMDFWVFAWPNPDNTISDQYNYLDSKLNPDDHEQYARFYAMLRNQSERRVVDGVEVYGPFNHIKDLIK